MIGIHDGSEIILLAALIYQALRDAARGDADARQWVTGGDLDALLQQCGLDLTAQRIVHVGDRSGSRWNRRHKIAAWNDGPVPDSESIATDLACKEAEHKDRFKRAWVLMGDDPESFDRQWPELRVMLLDSQNAQGAR